LLDRLQQVLAAIRLCQVTIEAGGKKPFFVRAMYTNDKFTYIQARPEETPALYEVKDGKPSLINFQLSNGLYIVSKIVDNGYLVVGKKKATFTRQSTAK